MEEDKKVLLPQGEEYIFGEEAILEENIKILEDETNALGLFFKCRGMEVYKQALQNLLTRYKQLEQENNNLKAAALKNDDYYKEVCNKNKELKESCKSCVVRDRLHEYVENTIPKSLVKEKIEEYKKHLPDKTTYEEYKNGGMYSVIGKQTTYGVAIEVLQELLGEEK